MDRFPSLQAMIASQDPTSVAFEYLEEGSLRSLTYGDFFHNVAEYRLPKAPVVGLMFSTDLKSITAFFALAGKRRLVLLNPDDPKEVNEKRIKATGVSAIVGEVSEMDDFVASQASYEASVDPDILMFTSGTTDSSKAVVLTEANLCNAAFNGGSLLPLTADDKLLSMLPLSHVFGLVCALLWPMSFGSSVCLGNGIRGMFTDFALYKPTSACLVPQMARFLSMNKLLNSELSLVLIGAGVCDDQTLAAIAAMGIRVSYGYGLTETSSGIALSIADDPRAMTICPDYEVSIAQDDEILVKSATTLMKGYFNDKAGTDAVLIDGWLHTGDLGRIENGFLYITGRKKETLVFSDGSKVFLPEYEKRLGEILFPEADYSVLQAEGGELVLVIHCATDVQVKVDMYNSELPMSHRIAKIVYVQETLPRTATGKVKRHELVQLII